MTKFLSNKLLRLVRMWGTWGIAFTTLALSVAVMQPANAQISQTPLLTQSGSVEPNLVLMFDDSGSMPAQFLYQYGGNPGGYGMDGPGSNSNIASCPRSPSMTTTCTPSLPGSTEYQQLSSDINSLTYDPRKIYKVRLDSVGSTTTSMASVVTSTTAFYVYFYRDASGNNVTWPGTGNDPLLATSYFGATTTVPVYTPSPALLVTGATTGLTYPNAVVTGTGPFPRFINRTDCNGGALTGGSCSLAEERLNYAIWKKYHSNRLDLAKTGLGWAFKDIGATLRLGWGRINTLEFGTLDSGVSLFTDTVKASFYTWLYSIKAPGNTPNRIALDTVGKYFSRSDNLGPWANTPDPTSTGSATLSNSTAGDTLAIRKSHYSCRRSYAMLMTDGYYNDGSPGVGEVDSTAITTIVGTSATGATLTFNYDGATKPYFGGGANTFADVAMKYWITDLRPGLTSDLSNDGIDNKVKQVPDTVVGGVVTKKGNESFWQNMGFYAIGLGVDGTPGLPQNSSTLADLTSGAKTWTMATINDPKSIDDMWHATINARGSILSAKNSDALSDAVEGMVAEINKNTSSQSGVAASTLSLTSGTRKYTPKYTTGTWTGNVIASVLDPVSSAEVSVAWQVVGTVAPTSSSGTITYSGIPAYTSRNIYAWNGTAIGSFDSSNTYVNSNVVGANANLINYLRGDQSNEDTPSANKLYRTREFLLGDIVNSSPVLVKGALNSSYDLLPAGNYGQSSYTAFLATKAAREGVLFVGANDGMMHGFRDTTGVEVFAFVPRAVMPNLHLLASRSYNHQYYVDGPSVEADACLTGGSSCSTWSNLLLGTAGAGAKTVFALDVTNPTAMSAANVKWEITPSTTGFGSLGHVLTDVQTGLTASGQWVAIFGNGYYSAGGVASLYIADLDTGALIKQISTGVGSSNGLGGVRLVLDANQRIVGAYAGDLQGNLWKFDLSNSVSSSWGLGLSSSPLYKATSTQAITAQPTIVSHPNGGNVVTFGTGKLFDATDVSNTTTQSLYGVWDSVAFGSSTTPTGVTQTGVSSLVQQTISASISGFKVVTSSTGTTSTVSVSYYSVSANPVDWATKRGWYINLPNTGQRVVYPSTALVSGYILTDTVSPSNVSIDPCVQSGSGRAWNYVLNGLTGSGPTTAIFDTDGNGVINSTDAIVSGYENTADGRTRVIKNDSKSTSTGVYYNPLSTEQQPGFIIPTGSASSISGVVRRSWRQLFLR
jgi:type IV pilus assembly protein PilY1